LQRDPSHGIAPSALALDRSASELPAQSQPKPTEQTTSARCQVKSYGTEADSCRPAHATPAPVLPRNIAVVRLSYSCHMPATIVGNRVLRGDMQIKKKTLLLLHNCSHASRRDEPWARLIPVTSDIKKTGPRERQTRRPSVTGGIGFWPAHRKTDADKRTSPSRQPTPRSGA